jgi:hypothetical protein
MKPGAKNSSDYPEMAKEAGNREKSVSEQSLLVVWFFLIL